LALYAPGFRQELDRQGYKPGAAGEQLLLMAHVSRSLANRGLDAGELTAVRLEQFLRARRAEGYPHLRSARAFSPLLEYLCGLGAVPVPTAAAPATPIEAVLERYSVYLPNRQFEPQPTPHMRGERRCDTTAAAHIASAIRRRAPGCNG
jgi:hypothetical protein